MREKSRLEGGANLRGLHLNGHWSVGHFNCLGSGGLLILRLHGKDSVKGIIGPRRHVNQHQ